MNDRIDAVLVDTSVYHKKQCDFEGITNSTSCPTSFAPRSHSFAKISELLFPRRLVETTRTFFAIVLTLLFALIFAY